MIGAVSAADVDSDSAIASSDDDSLGAVMPPIIIIDPDDPIDDPVDDEPTVQVDTKEIYVNDTGDDSNSGSKESPYATIKKAVSDVNASNDATIYIGQGTFSLSEVTVHFVDGDEEWDNTDYGLNINLDHKTYGGNLKFIGAGADKTFIDGQSAFYFASIGDNANVTIKDVTFINCKNDVGGVISSTGNLTIDGCEFKNSYATGSYAGAIYSKGSSSFQFVNGMFMQVTSPSTLTVTNSKFISVYTTNPGSSGGAIWASQANLYLENNSFIDTRIATDGLYGGAIYTTNTKSSIINNKFINVSGVNDGALYLAPDIKESIVTGNEFINCSISSDAYSIVNLANGKHVFENNVFINSSNPAGNIFAPYAKLNKLNFNTSPDVVNVTNTEINKGVEIPFNITDDMGNLVVTYQYGFIMTNENHTYSIGDSQTDNGTKLIFYTVPENGLYNLTVSYNDGEGISDVLKTVNVITSNDPIELYVSPKGSDADDGSHDRPFETIQHAIDVGFDKSFTVIVHLLKGNYSGDGNVELTISNKGNLQVIGEEHGKVEIDGKNANWFVSASTTNVDMINISFINGNSNNKNLIGSDFNLYLQDCIVDNNTVNSDSCYVMNNVLVDNLTYTNNYGRVNFGYNSLDITLSNSYFANNEFIDLNTGGILVLSSKLTIENSTFINNTATEAGVIYATRGLVSRNNYYANNKASQNYLDLNPVTANNGVIYTVSSGEYTFENDTFENNYAYESGVIGWGVASYSASQTRNYNFNNCNFINNSAVEAGVSKIKSGNFTNCKFINNSADYGGVFVLLPFVSNSNTLELNDVTFEGNTAKYNGNDIYLSTYSRASASDVYAMDLTLNFNNLNTSSLVDDLTVNVTAPCGAQVGGGNIYFLLDGNKIGSAEIVNGVATLNYAGFEDGQYNLSGYMDYQNNEVIVNNATVNVKLEGILDSVSFWVATNGSDEDGNGSQANPFKTIEHAISVASKNCRNITVNIAEGTYSGDLILSSMNNLTLVGAGVGSTFIDGGNTTVFATITAGNNRVTVSDLTVKNMLPDNRVSKTIDAKVPLTVEEGADLLLNNVEFADNHGGSAIIVNNGRLAIENSQFRRNGFSNLGLISGGNVSIVNSVFEDNYAQTRIMSADNLIINNSVIKNAYLLGARDTTGLSFDLINVKSNSKGNVIIENSIISNDGSIEDLNDLGVTTEGRFVNPALNVNGNTYMVNSSMINNFNGTLNTYTAVSVLTHPAAFGYTYTVPRNVTVINSSIINYNYLWMATTNNVHNFVFDGCVFENLEYIAWIRTNNPESNYNITNSVFLNCNNVINQNHFSRMETPKHVNLNNNYWGTNNQTTVYFLDSNVIKDDVVVPETWITLYSEDLQTVIKNVTDGENSTAYTGNAPIRTDYADNKGALDYAVVFGPVGYLFTTDDDNNVIFNPEEARFPFVAADPMDYRTPTVIVITGFEGDLGVVGILVDIVGNPIANAIITSTFGNLAPVNTTTDANGTFTVKAGKNGVLNIAFAGDNTYFDCEGNLTFANAGKTAKTYINLNEVKDDMSVTGVLVDDEGTPIANAAIKAVINGNETVNTTTDASGAFTIQGMSSCVIDISFEGDDVYNPSNATITLNNLAPKRAATVIEGNNYTQNAIDYYAGERGGNFTVQLKDASGKVLANKTVLIGYNGKCLIRTTDENGFASVQINLLAENRLTFAVAFLGDENYNATMSVYLITINKKAVTINAPAKTFKASAKTKSYTVTLSTVKGVDGKTYFGSGKKVTLSLNGKTYTAKTNAKGQATFKLTITKKGTFNAAVSYAGDNTYKAAKATAKIKIS